MPAQHTPARRADGRPAVYTATDKRGRITAHLTACGRWVRPDRTRGPVTCPACQVEEE